jgi:hypothetical protein
MYGSVADLSRGTRHAYDIRKRNRACDHTSANRPTTLLCRERHQYLQANSDPFLRLDCQQGGLICKCTLSAATSVRTVTDIHPVLAVNYGGSECISRNNQLERNRHAGCREHHDDFALRLSSLRSPASHVIHKLGSDVLLELATGSN